MGERISRHEQRLQSLSPEHPFLTVHSACHADSVRGAGTKRWKGSQERSRVTRSTGTEGRPHGGERQGRQPSALECVDVEVSHPGGKRSGLGGWGERQEHLRRLATQLV